MTHLQVQRKNEICNNGKCSQAGTFKSGTDTPWHSNSQDFFGVPQVLMPTSV